jgi:hypothetical protein
VADVVVKLDIFPASAVMGDSGTTYENVRVAVADTGEGDQVEIWRNESGGPALVFRSPLTGADGSIRTAFTLYTEQATLVAGNSGGCRCGQQLGEAQLWPGLRRINTTL